MSNIVKKAEEQIQHFKKSGLVRVTSNILRRIRNKYDNYLELKGLTSSPQSRATLGFALDFDVIFAGEHLMIHPQNPVDMKIREEEYDLRRALFRARNITYEHPESVLTYAFGNRAHLTKLLEHKVWNIITKQIFEDNKITNPSLQNAFLQNFSKDLFASKSKQTESQNPPEVNTALKKSGTKKKLTTFQKYIMIEKFIENLPTETLNEIAEIIKNASNQYYESNKNTKFHTDSHEAKQFQAVLSVLRNKNSLEIATGMIIGSTLNKHFAISDIVFG